MRVADQREIDNPQLAKKNKTNLMNAFMVIPNIIALRVLSPVIWSETKEFLLTEKADVM